MDKICNRATPYIFRYVQRFATKLCNLINFKMLFLAVMKDLFIMPESKFNCNENCLIQVTD